MKRMTLSVVACAATALVLASALSSVAAAAEMFKPEFSVASKGKGTSAAALLSVEGGASVGCKAGSGIFEFEPGSREEGPGILTFTGCTQGGESCRSLGDALGTVLVKTLFRTQLILLGGVDHRLLGFELPSELHIECAKSAVKLLLVKGSLLGEIHEENGIKPTTNFVLTMNDGVEHKGPQEFSKCENFMGEIVESNFSTSQEGGKAKKTFMFSESNKIVFEKNTELEK